MKLVSSIIVLSTMFTLTVAAQKGELIDGRIRLVDGSIIPVKVENKITKEVAHTDEVGYYMLMANVGDTLQLSSPLAKTSNYVVDADDLKTLRVNLTLEAKGRNLEEIVIIKKDFGKDFFNIGDHKVLSPAERNFKRNNTLTSATPTGGLGISLSAFYNLLSGKRKEDKQAIYYERLNTSVQSFLSSYPKEELLQDLKIDQDTVDAFLYYLVAQPDFHKVPVERSEGYILFLAQYYDDFLNFIAAEK